MHDFINSLLESNTLAFIVSLAIFIVTLFLVVRRSIGFFVTLMLLIFAIVSGFFVANQDIFSSFLRSFANDPAKDSSHDSYALFKQQLEKSYHELKDEFSQQKKEFQELFAKIRSENPDSKEPPSETPEKKDASENSSHEQK
jgi:glucan phosphoethanolaminetransferase (alkaline phosphatase superfamily)